MEHATIVSGFGGQGLLFAGQVLAHAAMLEGRQVSWMPSYGPEMRGGTASCTVIVADQPIGSPIVDAVDALIALNAPSLARYEPLLVPGGLLVVDATSVESAPDRPDVETVSLPATELAREAGDERLVSIVALGALVGRRTIVQPETVRAALAALLIDRPASLLEADLAAFSAGLTYREPARVA
jgi:2-oxoglutarate ferredoxin oxidoreductase subunit gamma